MSGHESEREEATRVTAPSGMTDEQFAMHMNMRHQGDLRDTGQVDHHTDSETMVIWRGFHRRIHEGASKGAHLALHEHSVGDQAWQDPREDS
jgi:hypothetical protein